MSQSQTGFQRSFVAAADLSGDQYRFVSYGSQNEVARSEANAADAAGVLINGPTEGEHANVQWLGSVKAIAGAELSTPGTEVTTDGEGRVVAATAGQNVVGRTVDTAEAAGDEIEIFLTLGARVPA